MIDFLIFYEVGVREFESIALLGYELKRRGYSVEYFGFEDTNHNKYIKNRKWIKSLRNNVDTVITPSLYHNKEIYNTIYYVCGKCKHLVNLRWEQYFGNGPMNDMNCVLFPHENAKKAYHLCWGQNSFDSLVVRGLKKELLPITGAIQLDFLRPEFAGFYLSKEELFKKYDLSVSKDTVLYLSSFATATRTDRLKEAIRRDFDGNYDFKDHTFEFHRRSYEITVDWIEQFLQRHPDVQFVYRPHPAENLTDVIAKLKMFANFKIISDFSVKQWILCCEIITTWVSTSIAEAYFANKYCYVIRPLPYPEDIDICIYKGVKFIDNLNDFLNVTQPNNISAIDEEKIGKYYYISDEKPSYILASDAISDIHNGGAEFPWNEVEMKAFDKKNRLLFIRNLVFFVYIGLLKMGAYLNSRFKIRFFRGIQSRIDNLNVSKQKQRNNSLTLRNELMVTIDRVNSFMKH